MWCSFKAGAQASFSATKELIMSEDICGTYGSQGKQRHTQVCTKELKPSHLPETIEASLWIWTGHVLNSGLRSQLKCCSYQKHSFASRALWLLLLWYVGLGRTSPKEFLSNQQPNLKSIPCEGALSSPVIFAYDSWSSLWVAILLVAIWGYFQATARPELTPPCVAYNFEKCFPGHDVFTGTDGNHFKLICCCASRFACMEALSWTEHF